MFKFLGLVALSTVALAADPAEIGHAQRVEPKHQIAQDSLQRSLRFGSRKPESGPAAFAKREPAGRGCKNA